MQGHISAVNLTPEGVRSQGFVLIPGPRKGIIRAFEPPADASVIPPAFVDQQASLYGGTYFNLPVLWSEIKKVIRQFSPQMYQNIQNQLNAPQIPFHPERDLINTFGDRWYLYLPSKVVSESTPREIHGVLAADVRESETLQATINKLLAMYDMGVQKNQKNYKGTSINQLPPIPMGQASSAAKIEPIQICYFFRNGYMVISTSLELAKNAIDDFAGGVSPLVDQPRYEAVSSGLLESPSTLLYADQQKIGRLVWKLVRKVFANSNMTLPSYQTLSQYLYVCGTSARWTQDGIETRGWQPYPEE